MTVQKWDNSIQNNQQIYRWAGNEDMYQQNPNVPDMAAQRACLRQVLGQLLSYFMFMFDP